MKGPAQKRWYDQHSTISKSIRLMETFPPEIQDILAEGIIRLAARECQAKEMMVNLRSLGPEKVLGIFKSKNKRRAYDKNLSIHQAMNYLFILSEENRLFIAHQVIDIVNFIYGYLQDCKSYQTVSSVDDIAQLTNVYIDAGAQEAQQLFEKIHERLNDNITRVVLQHDEMVIEGSAGLRVREESSPRQD